MRFIKVSPKDNDDVNNMFHMVLGLFPRKEKFQHWNSFTKNIPCRRKSMVFEIENTFGSSCYLKISPSLISLDEFTSDEDIAQSNFKIIPDFNWIDALWFLMVIYHWSFNLWDLLFESHSNINIVITYLINHSNINIVTLYLDFTLVTICYPVNFLNV